MNFIEISCPHKLALLLRRRAGRVDFLPVPLPFPSYPPAGQPRFPNPSQLKLEGGRWAGARDWGETEAPEKLTRLILSRSAQVFCEYRTPTCSSLDSKGKGPLQLSSHDIPISFCILTSTSRFLPEGCHLVWSASEWSVFSLQGTPALPSAEAQASPNSAPQ